MKFGEIDLGKLIDRKKSYEDTFVMVIGMFLDMNLSRRTRAHAKKDNTMLTLECATASCDCKRY